MEMSGGSAVGAVYPPDLPKALEDCERCFAKGPTYSSEYRIRKRWNINVGIRFWNEIVK